MARTTGNGPCSSGRNMAGCQEACGIFNVWVDEMPQSTELGQETALQMAKDYFRQMWGVDANAEAWQIYTAFGYNRMEPMRACGSLPFRKQRMRRVNFSCS